MSLILIHRSIFMDIKYLLFWYIINFVIAWPNQVTPSIRNHNYSFIMMNYLYIFFNVYTDRAIKLQRNQP